MQEDELIHQAKANYDYLVTAGWNEGIVREYLKKDIGDSLPLLRLEHVSKKINGTPILHNINLEIYPGEIFGLVGLTGAGKSTLLQLIVGYIPYNGDILIKNEDMDLISIKKEPELIKNLVGFSPQRNSFYPEFSVRENLVHYALLYGFGEAKAKKVAERLIGESGLGAFADKQAEFLSSGLKKQLDIMCALVHEPSLLILDEPTADLDIVSQQRLWEMIRTLHAKGTSILLSSHHAFELEKLCHRIGILHKGSLLKIGRFQDLAGPFLDIYELFIKTEEGNYDWLGQGFENLGYAIRRVAQGLIVYTKTPEKTMREAGTLIEHQGDRLLDMKLSKPGMEQFIRALAYHA